MLKKLFRQDLLLACLLVILIALMIIPLPQMLMDVFIGLNITLAVLLLMVSIYLKNPADFSTFPSVILYGTAFRLAISIATTRLILTEADAGQIIDTFGKFVIGGNLVVGLVIFLIITLVQFLVITKGAERVAEVAARFCLDALPGKQMSIDIQVRSGALTEEEGLAKRNKLDKGNQFFGAMDGAMKFVKGDAMAGLIITAINLIGGIAVGVTIHGFSLGQSLTVYSLLTIGDGLVAQIPALFMSVCAATIVTRVTDEESKDLGSEMFAQLAMFQSALRIAGTVVLGFAIIPGFPWHVFMVLSGILFLSAHMMPKTEDEDVAETAEEKSGSAVSDTAVDGSAVKNASDVQEPVVQNLRVTDRYKLYLGKELQTALKKDKVSEYRLQLYQDWHRRSGINFPVFQIGEDINIDPWGVRVEFDGVPAFFCKIPENSTLIAISSELQPLLPKGAVETDANWPASKGAWVPDAALDNNEDLSSLAIPLGHILIQIPLHFAERFAGQLFTRVEYGYFLREVEAKDSDLVNNLIQTLGMAELHNILRKLVEDGVPLSPPRLVLETLYHAVTKTKDIDVLVENLRTALRRQISHALAGEDGMLAVVLLDPDTEEVIREHAYNIEGQDQNLVLPPHISEKILSQFYSLNSSSMDENRKLTVVISGDLRRYLKNYLMTHNLHYPVIAYQEIAAEVEAHPVTMIQLNKSSVTPIAA